MRVPITIDSRLFERLIEHGQRKGECPDSRRGQIQYVETIVDVNILEMLEDEAFVEAGEGKS